MPKNSSKAGHRVKITFHLQLACRGRLACEGGPGCIPSEARDLLFPEMCAPIFDLIGAGRVPWKFRPSQSGHCSKIGSCYPGRAFLARRISPLASCLSVSRGRDIRFFWSAAASLPLLGSQPNRQLFPCGLSLEPLSPAYTRFPGILRNGFAPATGNVMLQKFSPPSTNSNATFPTPSRSRLVNTTLHSALFMLCSLTNWNFWPAIKFPSSTITPPCALTLNVRVHDLNCSPSVFSPNASTFMHSVALAVRRLSMLRKWRMGILRTPLLSVPRVLPDGPRSPAHTAPSCSPYGCMPHKTPRTRTRSTQCF